MSFPPGLRGRPVLAAAGMLATALAVCASAPAHAQSRRAITLRLDNDAFNFWQLPALRPDEEYTSGVHLIYSAYETQWWARALTKRLPDCAPGLDACRAKVLEFGQDIFTPRRTRDAVAPPPGSRPNAGWLYVDDAARILHARRSDEFAIVLGVTGAPAFAQAAQRLAHSFAPAFNRPTDWHDQIGFEPGVILRYEQVRRIGGANSGAVAFDLLPRARFELGNVSTAVETGVRARAGMHLRHPWLPAPANAPPEITLSVGASVRGVARDLFLDGNTYHGGTRVGHEPFTHSYDWSVTVRHRRLMLSYGAVTDSRAYVNGPASHTWSSLVAGVTFDR